MYRSIDLFTDTAAILNSIVSNSYYGILRGQISIYYMEKSVLLGTKPLVDSIRHFIRDPSGVFSV